MLVSRGRIMWFIPSTCLSVSQNFPLANAWGSWNVCEQFDCKYNGSIYFKCPGYYCVRWYAVCNGVLDCPGGTDEVHCINRICPGQFKCHNTSTCVAIENLCDKKHDCILGDDEYFCDPEPPGVCANNCSCIVYSIFCTLSWDAHRWFVAFQETFTCWFMTVHLLLKTSRTIPFPITNISPWNAIESWTLEVFTRTMIPLLNTSKW